MLGTRGNRCDRNLIVSGDFERFLGAAIHFRFAYTRAYTGQSYRT